MICSVCQKPHPWPDGTMPRHPFNGIQAPEAPSAPAHPFDPVLRQALIDKGVLTPDDLRQAEAKINVITGRVLNANA